jgi:hypothetical protein
MRSLVRSLSFGLFAALLGAGACGDPGAAVEIRDAQASRDAVRRVVVDVELLARESLGGNVGTYCVRVTFTGQAEPREQCSTDLQDGDTKVIRFTSDGDLPPNVPINIRVRLGSVDVGRSLAAPP